MSILHRASAALVIVALVLQPAWGRPPLFRRSSGMQQQPQPVNTNTKTQTSKTRPATPPTPAAAPAPEASAQIKSEDIAPPKFPPEPVIPQPPAISLDKKPKEENPPAPAEAFTAKPTETPSWWTRIPTNTAPTLFVKPETPTVTKPFSLVQTPEVKSDTGSTQEATKFSLIPTEVKSDTDSTQDTTPPPAPAALITPEAATNDPYTPPAIELLGVDKALPLGELVQIAIKPTTKPERLRSSTYSWTVLPSREVVVWPDASKIIFGAGTKPQTFTVVVTGSHVFAPDPSIDPKAEVIQRLVTKIQLVQVGGGAAMPPPDPSTPTPDLTPVAKKIFEFTQLVVTDNNSYNTTAFKTDAALLARNFADIVKAIEDPDPANRAKLATIADIMKATKNRNDANKISNRTAWQAWFDQTEELIRQAYSNNTIRSPQDAAVWWRDISAGLAAAAR